MTQKLKDKHPDKASIPSISWGYASATNSCVRFIAVFFRLVNQIKKTLIDKQMNEAFEIITQRGQSQRRCYSGHATSRCAGNKGNR